MTLRYFKPQASMSLIKLEGSVVLWSPLRKKEKEGKRNRPHLIPIEYFFNFAAALVAHCHSY